jgi:hypothetical protein
MYKSLYITLPHTHTHSHTHTHTHTRSFSTIFGDGYRDGPAAAGHLQGAVVQHAPLQGDCIRRSIRVGKLNVCEPGQTPMHHTDTDTYTPHTHTTPRNPSSESHWRMHTSVHVFVCKCAWAGVCARCECVSACVGGAARAPFGLPRELVTQDGDSVDQPTVLKVRLQLLRRRHIVDLPNPPPTAAIRST